MSGRSREDGHRGGDAAPAFAVECPGCRAHVAVSSGLVGRVAGCPRCHAPFLVPAPGHEEPVPAEAPRSEPRQAAPARSQPAAPLVFSEPPAPSTRRPGGPAADAKPASDAPVPTAADDAAPVAAPAAATDVPDGLVFREPVRTVRSGGTEIELRRLTPEEKQARRTRRNLIFLVVGAALLVALVVILGKGGR